MRSGLDAEGIGTARSESACSSGSAAFNWKAMRQKAMKFASGWLIAALASVSAHGEQAAKDVDKPPKQLGKLDLDFVKALTDLAKKYDKDQVPEAAHFFASCALGFGGKDENLNPIKASYEVSVYLGRLRGGEPLKETAAITGALGSVSTAYKKILDPLIARARKGGLPEPTRKLMLDTGVKYELSRGAHEYVQATQRFNALRQGMKLRAILWEFEESRKLILAGWYTCETGDWEYKDQKKDSAFYTPDVGRLEGASWGPHSLKEYPEVLRSYVLVRQDLLNPNCRQIRLGHWKGGNEIEQCGLYVIPQLPYRDDIPTPSQRFRGETVVKDWLDVEETVEVKGKKVPYVRYPYPNEPDAPRVFSNGQGGMEMGGWAKSEYDFLEKAGLPIMLRLFVEGTISDIGCELKDATGKSQACRVYSNDDKRIDFHRDYPTILLIPEKHLNPSVQYSVTVRCRISDTPFEKMWSFTTRPR